MGRTHSNAYSPGSLKFFDTRTRARSARRSAAASEARGQSLSPRTGASDCSRDRLAQSSSKRDDIDAVDICLAQRLPRLRSRIAACMRHGKMVLCEKPLGRNGEEGAADGGMPWRKPACPTSSGTTTASSPPSAMAKNIVDSRGTRPHLPLPRQLPPGLDHCCRRPSLRAAKACGASMPHAAGSPVSPATCSPTASTPRMLDQRRRSSLGLRHDRNLHQGARAPPPPAK